MSNIHTALLEVMKETGYVQKGGTMQLKKATNGNKGISYKYAGEVDLIKAIRPHLVTHGITFYCSNVEVINSEDFTTEKEWNGVKSYTTNHRCFAKYSFTLTHAESDTSVIANSIGDGMDTGDKAAYKAATGALKYILRQTFIVETGDDPDKTASEEQEGWSSAKEIAGNSSPLNKKNFATISNAFAECNNNAEVTDVWSKHKLLFNRFKEEKPDEYERLIDIGASMKKGFGDEAK